MTLQKSMQLYIQGKEKFNAVNSVSLTPLYSIWWEAHDKYSTPLRLMQYLQFYSHLMLYISYKLAAVL